VQVAEGYDYPTDDPLIAVKTAYLLLRELAELSCRHRLPIIFWGESAPNQQLAWIVNRRFVTA
jgi:hypothetical protein